MDNQGNKKNMIVLFKTFLTCVILFAVLGAFKEDFLGNLLVAFLFSIFISVLIILLSKWKREGFKKPIKNKLIFKKDEYSYIFFTLLLIFLLNIIFSNSSVRKSESLLNSYNAIISVYDEKNREIVTLAKEHEECFLYENTDISLFCIEGITKIKEVYLERIEVEKRASLFYSENEKDFYKYDFKLIQDNIKVQNSKEYLELQNSAIDFLTISIDFYSYFHEGLKKYVTDEDGDPFNDGKMLNEGIKKYTSDGELISKKATEVSIRIEEKRQAFYKYLTENYDKDFIEKLKLSADIL